MAYFFTQKAPTARLSKPQECEVVQREDFMKQQPPLQSEFEASPQLKIKYKVVGYLEGTPAGPEYIGNILKT